MPPAALNKLVALQRTRLAELKSIHRRLMARPLASLEVDLIQPGIDALATVFAAVRQTHEEIAVRPDALNDPYMIEDEIEEIREAYDEAFRAFVALRRQLVQSEASTPTRESSHPQGFGLDPSFSELPKMSLPKFSGDEEDWENFFDSFRSMVHEAPRLDDTAKLRYLKSCLVGEAAGWIKDVSTSTANYASTWEALKARYYNPMLLLFKKLQALLDLPRLKRESIAELRSLLDRMQCIVRSLKNAGWPVENWDSILYFLLVTRLDVDTRKSWNAELISMEGLITASGSESGRRGAPGPCFMPTFAELVGFLEKRARVRCSACKGKHHTLIHTPSRVGMQKPASRAVAGGSGINGTGAPVSLHAATSSDSVRSILLATARVWVAGTKGKGTWARALLDQGSEVSFVSERITQLLGLSKRRTYVPLSGLGAVDAGTARSGVRVTIRSAVDTTFQVEVDALVLPKLTSLLPSINYTSRVGGDLFKDIPLADPEFVVSKRIDVILGADVYGQLLRPGIRRFSTSQLVAQDTALGWIISGPVDGGAARRAEATATTSSSLVLHCSAQEELNHILQRFWELEEVLDAPKRLKPEEEKCELIFQETHRRDWRGRYVVRLPLRQELPPVVEETRRMALSSLACLHRRFARDSRLAQAYRDFMRVYEELGHMSRVPRSEVLRREAWYLPHHAVVQQDESRWKLRVVFDASRRTRDGHSLNSFLLTGPPLQSDLSLILLNWRRYRVAFTADIVKMFRQIRVVPEHQDYQRIIWSPDAASEPVEFRLNTVTYGTACAPYLAIRTLSQLVRDEGSRYPLGSRCLESETYVDDTFAGADDIPTAVRKRDELIKLLDSAGIQLDKWAANSIEVLPDSARPGVEKHIEGNQTVKTLGVRWVPEQDEFRFDAASVADLAAAHTKRSVLSNIARLFDPLGWLSPVTVVAKILMQDMWLLKCDWDSPLPSELRERWYQYCQGLVTLPSLSVGRWLGGTSNSYYQIHGFSDASSRAYAAVVYLRIDNGDGKCQVSLLASKSKVAPVKTVSIPNLELCGAALLVRLIRHLTSLDFLQKRPIFAWSDSQIVLTWLRKHPCHWKTFVANRVSLIQTQLPSASWSHVPSKENPADLASRGVAPEELAKSALWWHGPSWLAGPSVQWPRSIETSTICAARTPPMPPWGSGFNIGLPDVAGMGLRQESVDQISYSSLYALPKAKPQLAHQLMGELPVDRVVGSRAFANSGLDYAGPVKVRMSKGRGNRSGKGYIALFVCFATRAIHLELVSDLSSESFLCAYRRFVGRRGICRNLYSDNATNFQGADKELKAMFRRASDFYHRVASLLANDGTSWTFIPPNAPHYGGLWEAGVKSVKHHLKRVVGEHTLTFEELSTVLVEIEACLNSRPLGPLSSPRGLLVGQLYGGLQPVSRLPTWASSWPGVANCLQPAVRLLTWASSRSVVPYLRNLSPGSPRGLVANYLRPVTRLPTRDKVLARPAIVRRAGNPPSLAIPRHCQQCKAPFNKIGLFLSIEHNTLSNRPIFTVIPSEATSNITITEVTK
ncbi:uncharacterized protein LOC122513563 [Polistes fuscatus]|uniref:uncharacterized protein LOC122513563 n=1 Tax=Polistes fuscatus TaxID=30207 RepID=UPI001CA9AF8A|nr:uncharacterized protein LOC122513563 [Polistes fuscatus]